MAWNQQRTTDPDSGSVPSNIPWTLLIVPLWWLTLLRTTLSNGDAAVYLGQVRSGDFAVRTIHLGYLWMLWPSQLLLPNDAALFSNCLSILGGFTALAALFTLSRRLFPAQNALGSVLLWVASASVVGSVSSTEIYATQVALQLLCLNAWFRGRSGVSGLLAAWSLAVSPTSIVLLPALLLVPSSRQSYAKFLIWALLPYGVMIGYCYPDYFWGSRGLFSVPLGMSLRETLDLRLVQLSDSLGWFSGLIPLVLLRGFWSEDPRQRRIVRIAVIQAFVTLLVTDRFRDVPSYLLTRAIWSLLIVESLEWFRQTLAHEFRTYLALGIGVLICLQLVETDQVVRTARRKEKEFRQRCESVYQAIGDSGYVVGTFSETRLYEWYADENPIGRHSLSFEQYRSTRTAQPSNVSLRLLSLPSLQVLPDGITLRLESDRSWSILPSD